MLTNTALEVVRFAGKHGDYMYSFSLIFCVVDLEVLQPEVHEALKVLKPASDSSRGCHLLVSLQTWSVRVACATLQYPFVEH